MSLRALVVDDEPLAREELCFLLAGLTGIEIVGEAADGREAIRLIEETTPDLVFLDVQMPGLGGFEVARRVLSGHLPSEIVFVTAFDQHAIEAFDVNAVDYLLKPVESGRLELAVQRARRRLGADRTSTNAELERLVQLIGDRQQRRQRLAVKVAERFQLIDAQELVYASLNDDVITVVADRLVGTASCRTLDELQATLDPEQFWRVHRAYLVNINKIKEIVPWFSRNYLLRMSDVKASEIPVSRAQSKRLREYLSL